MMLKQERVQKTIEVLDAMFPDAECELDFRNNFELVIAVALSAQTTDKAVNKVTPLLFQRFGTPTLLASANVEDVELCIQAIGLYKNKAKNIIALANRLIDVYDGVVPSSIKDLTSLPGVGHKTAEVVRAVGFHIPAFAVDTHVMRIAYRLGFVKSTITDPTEIGKHLKRIFSREKWITLHHQMIFFGRYHCLARNPKCQTCPLYDACRYQDKIKEGS